MDSIVDIHHTHTSIHFLGDGHKFASQQHRWCCSGCLCPVPTEASVRIPLELEFLLTGYVYYLI